MEYIYTFSHIKQRNKTLKSTCNKNDFFYQLLQLSIQDIKNIWLKCVVVMNTVHRTDKEHYNLFHRLSNMLEE